MSEYTYIRSMSNDEIMEAFRLGIITKDEARTLLSVVSEAKPVLMGTGGASRTEAATAEPGELR